MRSKFQQLLGVAALSAVIVLLVGGFVLSLTETQTPVVEAQTLAVPPAQTEPAASRTITVVGEGKVEAQPDIAQVNIGVEVIGPDVKQASNDAAADMEALLAALKAQGVADQDIETSYYNVWVERPYNPDGTQTTEALYHVSNNVQVTIRDLSNVATILGAAIEAGANTINSVTFNVAEPSELRSEARQKAVDDALATAQELAALNGVNVGNVVDISEVINQGAYYVSEVSSAAAIGAGGAGGPISAGQVEVTVQLQVTYAIQ